MSIKYLGKIHAYICFIRAFCAAGAESSVEWRGVEWRVLLAHGVWLRQGDLRALVVAQFGENGGLYRTLTQLRPKGSF